VTSDKARALRRNQTDAERKLWSALRDHQLAGHWFRRQAPIGPYVADFVCFAKRFIIEVDGGQHAIGQDSDDRRTEWLTSQGFHVIRFWNNDVLQNIEGVCASILSELGKLKQ
jgi:very-short-patch-repair endonuclease